MRHIVLWLVLIGLTGCAGMGYREAEVKVNIASLQLLESTLMEQRYLVKLRLQNRSPRTLRIEGMSFDVELNSKDFASGVSNQSLAVPAYDEALVEVKVSSTLFGIIRQLQSMQQPGRDSFDYRISGRVNTVGGYFSLPFEESGVIDLHLPTTKQLDKR
jgi:LEA14-like dessication related protein